MTTIATIKWTCLGCPMQAEGVLSDGRHYYYRYRWALGSFGVGMTPDEAVRDPDAATLAYGDEAQGILELDEADRMLNLLMAQRLETA